MSELDDFLAARCSHDNEDLREAARLELAALRAEKDAMRKALLRMIDRAETVRDFDDDGDITAAREALAAKERT